MLRIFLTLIVYSVLLFPQEQLINVQGRQTTSLNGEWSIIIDPYETGFYNYRLQENPSGYFKNEKPKSKTDLIEYDFDKSDKLNVPGDWNTQRKELFFYEGTVWYKKSFNYTPVPGRRQFIHFDAVNYKAIVYVNGTKTGSHTGGFTAFNFEITSLLKAGENFVVVKADNKRLREGVPTSNTDWWNYGGITRDVSIIDLPENFIKDYFIQLDKNNKISGWVKAEQQAPIDVNIKIAGAGIDKTLHTDRDGYVSFSFSADVKKWSPESPVLYDVCIQTKNDTIKDRVGFRSLEVKGKDILLNGRPIYLRGISIHEESPIRGGRAFTYDDAERLLKSAKELGCNFVRLAHYPHNEYMTRLADEMGLMVWSEIPVYWTILWDNNETYDLALQQISEMITRDRNRASVIIWSVANETPRSESRLKFLIGLINKAREMDSTRLISAATELSYSGKTITVDDPLSEYLDVIGANEYLGWYSNSIEEISQFRWVSKFNKPMIISEFGGDAKYGFHGDEKTRWSEEYQDAVYREQIKMLSKVNFIRGISPWILYDFRSPRRPLPGIQDYFNRKGLISNDGNKKQAFYRLQKFYLEKEKQD